MIYPWEIKQNISHKGERPSFTSKKFPFSVTASKEKLTGSFGWACISFSEEYGAVSPKILSELVSKGLLSPYRESSYLYDLPILWQGVLVMERFIRCSKLGDEIVTVGFDNHQLDPQSGPPPGSFTKMHSVYSESLRVGPGSHLIPKITQGWEPLRKTRQWNENHQKKPLQCKDYVALKSPSRCEFTGRHPESLGLCIKNVGVLVPSQTYFISGMCILNADPK